MSYDVINKYNRLADDAIFFMNDGYVDIDENGDPIINNIKTPEKFSQWKYQVNLYKKSLDKIKNKTGTILEISCGKGCGLNLINEEYTFSEIIGVDINSNFCSIAKKNNKNSNIKIYENNATNLYSIENESVDSIITIEAFNYYIPFENYVSEVSRVLKKNGQLIQVGTINKNLFSENKNAFMNLFQKNNLICRDMTDITKNVSYACSITKNKFLHTKAVLALIDDEKRLLDGSTLYLIFDFLKI